MKTFTLKTLLKAALLTVLPATALAEPVQEYRCTNDSLDITQALARIEWARKCSLTTNSRGAFTTIPSTDKAMTGTTENELGEEVPVWANDYQEVNTLKAFTGNLHSYNINYYHAFSKFQGQSFVSESREATGTTANFYKWKPFSSQRPRPLYPTFYSNPTTVNGQMLFPHPTLADCNLYTDKSGSAAARWVDAAGISKNFHMVGLCEASCYAPDQNLLFSDGEANIVEAMKSGREDLMTLSPDATLDNLSLRKNTVYSYTAEIHDAEHVIYEISTAMGGKLRITSEHPVITSEGRLVKAESLKEGDELLKADGTPDRIVSVEKTTHFGKVYNIKPVSRDPVSNILVAQGFLVGSARFQNDDVEYMNRVLLYRAVPEEVMPQ